MSRDTVTQMSRETIAWIHEIDQHPLIGSVIRGEASREDYVAFLSATYHYLRWSGPLLARTAEGLRRRGRAAWLAAVLDRKCGEESSHERWVLQDLERCGENVDLIKAAPVPTAVRAYLAWSLTMADAGSPAFLGAAYALEVISMERAGVAAQNLIARRAIPEIEHAVTFLQGHGEADPGHVAAILDVLQRLDDPRDLSAVALSASVLRALYPCFFPAERAALRPIATPIAA